MNSVNFLQIPINRPIVPVHNNQRDGYMQQNIYAGKVAYYPNGLQGNTPALVDPDKGGYIEYPERVSGEKRRGRAPSFFDFYSQPQLFWNSLTEAEKQQLVDGARFEVGKCKSFDVRARFVDQLNHIDNGLARRVAAGVGVPLPEKMYENPGQSSVGISIEEYPKADNIRTRTVAILTAPGTNIEEARTMYGYLAQEGAYVEYIGLYLGDQDGLNITNTYLTTSSVLYDALYVPGGQEGIRKLMDKVSLFPFEEPKVFVMDAFRHGKPIAASSEGVELLMAAEVEIPNHNEDGVAYHEGVVIGNVSPPMEQKFKEALIQQRFWSRLPIDPPI